MFRRRTPPSARRRDPVTRTRGSLSSLRWSRLLGYLRPYRARMAVAVVALILGSALSLVLPVVIRNLIDSVFVEQDQQLLTRITIGLILVFLVRAVASLVETYTLGSIGERITADLRNELYQHLLRLSMDFHQTHRVGELISRLTNDVTTLRATLTRDLGALLQQTLVLVGAVALMFVLNPLLSRFILILAPVMGVLAAGFGLFLQRASTRLQDELAGSTVVAEEVLQNIRVVKGFAREGFEIERFGRAVLGSVRAALRMLRIRSVFGAMIAFFGFSVIALILWFGGREVLAGRLTAGELIAFLIYGLTVAASVGTLVGLYASFQESIGASQRVFELIDTPPQLEDAPGARLIQDVRGEISFRDVHFGYEDEQHVLRGISLEIARGEVLALVGPSGAGKSTIFNLVPRFYDPTAGSILLDGIDLRQITQHSLREHLAIVPQETILFGGSVEENIRYGRLQASTTEVEAAARAANAHEFIADLPQGYHTLVGERGVRLSGGQRQRVAIARALLKDPRLLLLDEATSSLDSESEQLVQEALTRLMQGRTTMIIAHRLSTVRHADRILVLDKGRIVEAGTHEALLAGNGLYARLHAMQFREMTTLEA